MARVPRAKTLRALCGSLVIFGVPTSSYAECCERIPHPKRLALKRYGAWTSPQGGGGTNACCFGCSGDERDVILRCRGGGQHGRILDHQSGFERMARLFR